MMAWFRGIGWFTLVSFAAVKTEDELHAWISVVVLVFQSAFSTNRRYASTRYVLGKRR